MLLLDGVCEFLYPFLVSAKRRTQAVNGDVLSTLFYPDASLDYRLVESTAGYAENLKFDILTYKDIRGQISENNRKDSPLIKYFSKDIYQKIMKGHGRINDFFELLSKEMENYIDDEKRARLIERINSRRGKKNNSINWPLTNDSHYAKTIYNYLNAKLQQSSINGQALGSKDFACALYATLYFIAFGNICQAFSEEIHLLDHDREEFVDKVLTRYGCSGNPGVYQVYALADRERPNAIALFEAAELEYYGKGYNSTPDFERVFDYCVKGISDPNHYNPLCAWDLAYVIYHSYKQDRAELKNVRLKCVNYDDLFGLYRYVANNLVKSYKSGCIASANVIAEMLMDEETPDEVRDILMTNCTSADEYLIYAAGQGYIYSMNNLFKTRLAEANSCEDHNRSESLEMEAYEWLKKSADLGEPWARNRYACYLYDQDRKQDAFTYYQRAAYANDPWGMYNLIEKYYLRFLWTNVDESSDLFCTKHREEIPTIIEHLYSKCLATNKTDIVQRVRFLQNIELLCVRSERFSSAETKNIFTQADYLNIAKELGNLNVLINNDIDELIRIKKQTTGLAVVWGSAEQADYIFQGTIGDTNSLPVSFDTVFDIASLTKIILSIAFFMLKDQGRVDLNQTLEHYSQSLFPNIKDKRIIDLMRFDCKLETAERIGSLPYDQALEQTYQVNATKTAESLDYQPEYSDIPALVLGLLFDQIADCSFGEFVEKYIIYPLGLKHTFWRKPRTDTIHVMDYSGEMRIKNGQLLRIDSHKFTVNDQKAAVLSQDGKTLMGNAGLFSSVEDIAAIAQALLQGRLVSFESLNEIGSSSGRPYTQKFGHLCYTKNTNKKRTEVFQAMSGNTFAISGFTGCYLMLDPQNRCFLFIGGNRLHNRITATDDTSLVQNGDTITFDNQTYIYSKDYVYMRDKLRDHLCMKLLWETSLRESLFVDNGTKASE